ncbi:MAG TPA: NAD(P)H-dependent glycerol-3-phosphate dehydrogenase [Xanthobacteraceae bacterium]|nr:NAD(P)H-dependent glycerol-3-phosphate dehydrogenase [Xanthobacteraceae bacterium]
MSTPQRISVLGAGAWGTALANAVANELRPVTLYGRDAAAMHEIARSRSNARLPGVAISSHVTPTVSLEQAADAEILLLVVPAQSTHALATSLAPFLRPGTALVACAKGIEQGTHRFMTEILSDAAPAAKYGILSGPSFALDVARGQPTAVTLAAEDETLAQALADALRSPAFRIYHSTDVRGVEIGGAAKNVLAIAAGIVAGRRLGASALAALVTRGFAELARFGYTFGARPETLMGLSGLGDLILSCTAPQSRNYSFGMALGAGERPAEAAHGKLAEGAFTAGVLVEMARAQELEMPVSEAVADVLAGRLKIDEAIARLLARPTGAEV